MIDEPRERVIDAIVSQIGRFPDLDLAALDTQRLEGRDAAFAHALYDAVIRRWLTLEHMIRLCLDRPDEKPAPKALAPMLVGAAQMIFLDKAPAYAAVNQSVEWAKLRAGRGVGGLVNAVLRRLSELLGAEGRTFREASTDRLDEIPLSDGRALALMKSVFPDDQVQRLAVATSNPVELIRAWTRYTSLREARKLALHGLVMPPIIVNTSHMTPGFALPPTLIPHAAPGHHLFTGAYDELVRLLAARRDIWVQDPASSLAISMISDLRPAIIVDVCAGMGTKTRQLAATFPEARIIATDIDSLRLETLGRSVDRSRVSVLPYEQLWTPHEKGENWLGKADLVVLDVPCSNTGVLARRVEARYRFSRQRTEGLTALQRQIMADSMRLLRRGGGGASHVLYSTCSLDPEENTDQVAWLARWHGLRLLRESLRAPEGLPGEPADRYSDGSYAALLG